MLGSAWCFEAEGNDGGFTFTSKDEKRCFMVTIAAAVGWYVQRSVGGCVQSSRGVQKTTMSRGVVIDVMRLCSQTPLRLHVGRDVDLHAF